MKKILTVILCISIAVCIFAACSNGAEDASTTALSSKAVKKTTQVITTGTAAVIQADAINLITSYSAKELGLTKDDMKKCSFMVASEGTKIKNDYYIKVIATIKIPHKDGDKTTFSFDNKGIYFIRYDGKKILSKNTETGNYTELKLRSTEPNSKK